MSLLDPFLYDYPSDIMPTPCKRFKGAKVRGHGSVRIRNQHWYAHRYTWYEVYKTKPRQLNHLCEHSDCCAVDHLYDGTQKQNVHDMVKAWIGKSSPLYFRCGHMKEVNNRYVVRRSKLTDLPVFGCVFCKRTRS